MWSRGRCISPRERYARRRGRAACSGRLWCILLLRMVQDCGQEYTPLLTAAKHGQREIARLLWERGGLDYHFIYDDPAYRHISPIEIAAKHRHAALVSDFLEWCPWMDEDLRHTLTRAARDCSDGIVSLLLAKGTLPTKVVQRAPGETLENSSCDDDAIGKQYATVCQLVDAAGDDWNCPSRYQQMLIRATSSGHLGVLRALLDKGADPNVQRGYDGMTPLRQYLASIGPVPATIATAEALLQHGASPELGDDEGETPMPTIAMGGDLNDVMLFLDYCHDQDAALRQRNIHGETLLHYAAMGKHGDVVEFLLSRGLDVNAVSNNGWTPLVCALMPSFHRQASDTVDMARLLLRHGARADVITAENWTPLHSLASWTPHSLNSCPLNHGRSRTWPGESDELAPLAQELTDRGAIVDAFAPVLRGKDITPRMVLSAWGVRMQRLAKERMQRVVEVRESNRRGKEFLEKDTAPHTWALRTRSTAVSEAIMNHLPSTPTSETATSEILDEM